MKNSLEILLTGNFQMEDKLYKFPSTPHVFCHPNIRQDKIISENERLLLSSKKVIIEEKIDGANLGISFNSDTELRLQNRGSFLIEPLSGQWKALPDWLKLHRDELFDCIHDRYIIFGEWCYAKHSIFYDSLPDYFLVFDVFDKTKETFLTRSKRNMLLSKTNLHCVPLIDEGPVVLNNLKDYIKKSKFSNEISEGIYLRIESSEYVDVRAKIVRSDFSQKILQHWSKSSLKRNELANNHFNKNLNSKFK